MRTIIYPGTFDPIHNGHLKVVTQVCAEMSLEEIIVVPAGYPYMKNDVLTSPLTLFLLFIR